LGVLVEAAVLNDECELEMVPEAKDSGANLTTRGDELVGVD